jgi:prophage regulatory protein
MYIPLTQSFSLLRIKELVKKLGVARSTIYDWMNPESPRHDPDFPQRIHIGKSAVRWDEAQVDAWIQRKSGLS